MSKLMLPRKAKQASDLMTGLGVYSEDFTVHRIIDDSRLIQAGDTFLCLPRAKDVQKLVDDAATAGAVGVIFVGTAPFKTELPCACLPDMTATGKMLRRWFETEGSTVALFGITGTDGKTSTAWMLRELLAEYQGVAWSCGTLGFVKAADDIVDLGNTTPSLLTLHAMLAMATDAKIGALVLEVSSHGIAQERIAGLDFKGAVWTTMGQDHLEDHGGFEAYLACKQSFVKSVANAGGVVVANQDYELIVASLSEVADKVYWYSNQDSSTHMQWSHGKGLTLKYKDSEIALNDVPQADFHAENLAAVFLMFVTVYNQRLETLRSFDGKISTPMGRLEPVAAGSRVFVDYAHTAEGLERCLQSARSLSSEQLLLVFGCGGNRDRAKRPEMGAVAVTYADKCWLTSDNPRDEEQVNIAADVMAGIITGKDKVIVCDDRTQAIEQAVCALGAQDVLVIAGKGHESYMEIKGVRYPWSDKAAALTALEKCEVQSCA